MKNLKNTYPRSLRSVSKKITNRIFRDKGFKEEKIIHEWENIVGKEIANFIIPTGLNKNKTIKVLCDSSFALELQHISPKIIDRINLNMGYKAVSNIQIMQTNLTDNENENQNKKNFEKDVISTKEHLEMEKIMNNVENEKIREKLISLSKTIFVKKENE